MAQQLDDIEQLTVLCGGGLNTSENFLRLNQENPGQAVTLVNYESSLTGGYRRINGYIPINSSSTEVTNVTDPAEGPGLGVWGYDDGAGTFHIFAARKDEGSSNYNIYESGALGWDTVTTGLTRDATGVRRLRTVDFTVGDTNYVAIVDGVNPAMLYDGTTWYELTSAGLGTSVSPGGDQIIDAPSYVALFKDTLFVARDATFTEIVAYSAPLNNSINGPFDWTAASGGGQVLPRFPVQQIKPFRDELYIFGLNAIKKVIPDAASGFVMQDVTFNVGCIAPDSVLEFSTNLIFLSQDGIRIVSGTDKINDVELSNLAQPIQRTIASTVSQFDLLELNGYVNRAKGQFRYFISSATINRPLAYGLIGNVRTYNNDRQWEYGELRGIWSNACWSGFNTSGQERFYHIDYEGNAYRQESGNSFDGSNIFSQYTTPFIYINNTIVRKSIKKLYTFIRSEGNVNLTAAVNFLNHGYGQNTMVGPNYSLTGGNPDAPEYDSGVEYDDGSTYGGATSDILELVPAGSGFATQITYSAENTDAPHTMQGFTVEYTSRGRR